jgi:dolichyl-phosphate-mannose--protein O-mannosyl transferase
MKSLEQRRTDRVIRSLERQFPPRKSIILGNVILLYLSLVIGLSLLLSYFNIFTFLCVILVVVFLLWRIRNQVRNRP